MLLSQMPYQTVAAALVAAGISRIVTLIAYLDGWRRVRPPRARWAIGLGIVVFVVATPYLPLVVGWFGLADAISHK